MKLAFAALYFVLLGVVLCDSDNDLFPKMPEVVDAWRAVFERRNRPTGCTPRDMAILMDWSVCMQDQSQPEDWCNMGTTMSLSLYIQEHHQSLIPNSATSSVNVQVGSMTLPDYVGFLDRMMDAFSDEYGFSRKCTAHNVIKIVTRLSEEDREILFENVGRPSKDSFQGMKQFAMIAQSFSSNAKKHYPPYNFEKKATLVDTINTVKQNHGVLPQEGCSASFFANIISIASCINPMESHEPGLCPESPNGIEIQQLIMNEMKPEMFTDIQSLRRRYHHDEQKMEEQIASYLRVYQEMVGKILKKLNVDYDEETCTIQEMVRLVSDLTEDEVDTIADDVGGHDGRALRSTLLQIIRSGGDSYNLFMPNDNEYGTYGGEMEVSAHHKRLSHYSDGRRSMKNRRVLASRRAMIASVLKRSMATVERQMKKARQAIKL